ncbi:hypothetical protein BCR37DRAFT_388300 [Protomyces lactucae-debilis]|uniref:Uncharacterized protein n=1 Tax=Protomyces lactucae-debilis TaxID=2754530 RepID=A0A1Y2F7P1_PROLT|nr:uncharacterized protein BCR37DRAFT_388300 [Protomyces lactucae-debilis]ORY79903.1 hypothetical protein BCR37DRAFT_388300 [Protomyces lactucae-debilis]
MKSLHHSLAVLMTVGLWALVMTDSDSEESGSSSADWSAADAPLQCQPLTIFLGKVVHMPYVNDPAAPDPSCLDICTDEMENYERGVISGGPAPGIACNAGNDVCVCLANWLDLGHTVNSDEAELYQHYYGGTAQFGSNLGTVSTELTHGTASGPTFWNAVAIMTHNSQLQRIRQWLRNNPQHGSSSSSARTSQGQADSFQTQQCFCAISIAYSSFRVDPSLCPLEGDYGIPGIPAMHAVGDWFPVLVRRSV